MYGIVWNTSLNTARRQAAESGREILLVHLDLQWKSHPHAAGLLALRVLDTEEFRRESGNYVLLLAARTPREPARIRRNREEISRIYNLGERDSGTLLLIDAAGKQLRRIPYRGEPAGELLRRLSEPEEGSSGNTVNQGGEKP